MHYFIYKYFSILIKKCLCTPKVHKEKENGFIVNYNNIQVFSSHSTIISVTKQFYEKTQKYRETFRTNVLLLNY